MKKAQIGLDSFGEESADLCGSAVALSGDGTARGWPVGHPTTTQLGKIALGMSELSRVQSSAIRDRKSLRPEREIKSLLQCS